ncbi:MAG: hypothetical protein CEO19_64 [Parcubacteria group bacterium Gr01-1014_73]|nr:MAG: hypothetical protein CEO19_64 [Parcubacteria group bacterium Gr01-1014_73]
MPKQMPQDVMPPGRRSIRRIPLSFSRKSTEKEIDTEQIFKKRGKKRGLKLGIWLVAVGAVLVLLVAAAFVFTGATVTIEPRQKIVNVDIEAVAKNPSELTYETIAIGGTKTVYLQATGESKVEKKASGAIVIYNNYSSSPQRLIKNTRFETPTGLIYRIEKSIVVPGTRLENGKTIPGSLETTIFADLPGPNYNIGLTDFTVPGFKGTPRYEGFYARSKTAMLGGFIGKVPTASEDKMNEAYASAERELKQESAQKISSQKPDTFVWYSSALLFESVRQLPTAGTGSMIALTVNATSTAVVFSKSILSRYIAAHSTTDYDKEPVLADELSDLIFTPRFDAKAGAGDSLPFSLKGQAKLIWQFDAAKLKSDLAGKSKKEISSIIAAYRGIIRTSVVIRPFWESQFPNNPSKIKINIVLTSN